MKAILGSLLCYVLMASQCFALKGGPFEGGKGQVVTTGNYAGLLTPTGTVNRELEKDNSMGIFALNVPTTGLASGIVALFRNEIFYPGTIQALIDPDSAILTGVLDSSFDVIFIEQVDTSLIITFKANGGISAKVRGNRNLLSGATARLVGSASITYATVGSAPGVDFSTANSECPDGTGGNCPILYILNGFKQS